MFLTFISSSIGTGVGLTFSNYYLNMNRDTIHESPCNFTNLKDGSCYYPINQIDNNTTPNFEVQGINSSMRNKDGHDFRGHTPEESSKWKRMIEWKTAHDESLIGTGFYGWGGK